MRDRDASDALIAQTRAHAPAFVGLSEEEAIRLAAQLNLILEIVPPSGVVPANWRPDRITVTISEGRVSNAKAG